MSRTEIEGRLGLSTHKVDQILDRAEVRTNQMYRDLVRKKGEIHYNAFLGKYSRSDRDVLEEVFLTLFLYTLHVTQIGMQYNT